MFGVVARAFDHHLGARRTGQDGQAEDQPAQASQDGRDHAATLPSPLGSGNTTLSCTPVSGRTLRRTEFAQAGHDGVDQHLGRRRAGRHSDPLPALHPRRVDVVRAVDQVRRHAEALRHFAQPVGVRAVHAAHHDHDIDLRRHELDGVLPVLGRVADVGLLRLGDRRKAPLERGDHLGGVVEREGRLRHVGERVRIAHLQLLDVADRLDEVHAAVGLPHRALDFRMARRGRSSRSRARPLASWPLRCGPW